MISAITPSTKRIEITSNGGDMITAIEVAIMVYQNDIEVVAKDHCSSACSIIWMASKNRKITKNGYILFHSTKFGNHDNEEEILYSKTINRAMEGYWRLFGLPESIIINMTHNPQIDMIVQSWQLQTAGISAEIIP
ncbi:MAG: hypothetical protein WC284_16845 [Candidimonas sp.]